MKKQIAGFLAATMVNRAFGTTGKASLSSFVDVPSSAWYYDDMAKAVHMQTFMGSGNQLNPDNFITREEAFAVLARAFKLSDANGTAINSFFRPGFGQQLVKKRNFSIGVFGLCFRIRWSD